MAIDSRIRRGTPNHSEKSICTQCNNSQIIRDDRSNERTYCHAGIPSKVITYKVVECSSFYQARTTSLSDMKEIAWMIEPDKKHMGFIKPKPITLEDVE